MYLLDTNVLIEAKNRYYAFDIAPGFWAWLDRAHQLALACSIEPVRAELLAGKDELAVWAQQHPHFFRPIDQGSTRHFGPLTAWASSQHFTQGAIAAFVGSAPDYLLIAYAKEHGHTLVTHERPDAYAKARILIPNACQAMGIEFDDSFRMLRETGARLDLRP